MWLDNKIGFIVLCENNFPSSLDFFLKSLKREIKFPCELTLVCNGKKKSFKKINNIPIPHVKLTEIAEYEIQKPQHTIRKALDSISSEIVILHDSRDVILDGYSSFLSKNLSLLHKDGVLKIPRKIVTRSKLFANREILSGFCFLREDLFSGIPYDFMFRSDSDIKVLKSSDNSAVFCHNDSPLFEKKIKIPISLVVTIKNRLEHWKKTMPCLVSQIGVDYELLIVDYYSEDNFQSLLHEYIFSRQTQFSPFLKLITAVRLNENKKFSSCKAKNLGVRHIRPESRYIAFSDIDTFLREDYISYWLYKVTQKENSFFVSRALLDRRLSTEVNYGNMIVPKDLYYKVQGHNEDIHGYGGDEDEFIHRMHNTGATEINPISVDEVRQYSILHGNEERLKFLEVQTKSGLQNWEFLKSKDVTWQRGEKWGKQDSLVVKYFFNNRKA